MNLRVSSSFGPSLPLSITKRMLKSLRSGAAKRAEHEARNPVKSVGQFRENPASTFVAQHQYFHSRERKSVDCCTTLAGSSMPFCACGHNRSRRTRFLMGHHEGQEASRPNRVEEGDRLRKNGRESGASCSSCFFISLAEAGVPQQLLPQSLHLCRCFL
jgi:hypothetical protein